MSRPPVPDQHTTRDNARPAGLLARLPWAGLAFLVPAGVSVVLLALLVLPLAETLLASAAAQEAIQPEAAVSAGQVAAASRLDPLGPDSPLVKDAPSRGAFWIDAPDDQVAGHLIGLMSDEETLGQLFLVGWSKETASGPVMDWLARRNLGGVKIFGWNGGKLSTLATALGQMQAVVLDSRLGIPLFTATDQEGGMVRHVKDTTSITPGNLALGSGGLAWDAYQSAALVARELRAIGINMNFAPTVDTYINAQAHVIGPRAFGSDPVLVGHLGVASLEGMRDEGVIATAKHFPGHGNAAGDSHGMMPVLDEKLETLWNRDFVPYRMMIPEGLPAIMISHLAFPKISGNEIPATLNPALNREILRGKLHFEGIVITDDLFMGGASVYASRHGWGMSDIVVEAIKAGSDVIEMSRTPELNDAIWSKSLALYKSDPAFKATVQASVRRILLVKLKYLKPATRVPFLPDAAGIYAAVPTAGAGTYFARQAARAVSILQKGAIPFKPAGAARIALIGQDPDFLRIGQGLWPQSQVLRFGTEPFFNAEAATIAQAQALAQRSDWVVFCLQNPNSQQVLEALRPWRDRILVMSTLTPVYLERLDWVKTSLAVYGQDAVSFRFGYAALTGVYDPPGTLPVWTVR